MEQLFKKNKINLSEIYYQNLILPENRLNPGLYRKTKSGQITNSDLVYDILNIYLNLTGKIPIINTLLIPIEKEGFNNPILILSFFEFFDIKNWLLQLFWFTI